MLDWRVPGYRVLRELRRGTVVGQHEASGHPVLLRYHPPGPESALTARRAEARTLADLTSPHIAALYEHIEFALPGQPEAAVGAVTVREYVDGASVRSLLAHAALPAYSALAVLRTGLLALQCAHERGVTHRGYKPENLLVDLTGVARLADFALTPTPTGPSDADPVHSATGPSDAQQGGDFTIRADVRAAYEVFVACLGVRDGRLPKRLRGLTAPGEAGDTTALLDAVEQAGRAGWGAQWRERGERELARRVAKARGRREARV